MSEYTLKPLSRAEQLYAYKQSQQIAGQTGCFGYYHGDFGESGVDYNAVWFGNSNVEMTDDFRNDLAEVMEEFGNESKAVHPFADRKAMSAFCLQNRNAAMKGNFSEEYGFRLDTERYSYFIRMEPHQKGDYDFYVFAYETRWLDRHMKKAAKDIKFIRSDYSLRFKLEDGDKIMIKYSDGETKTQECRYIDEYHTQIGGSIYHICQFAELIERNRATVIPYRDSLPEKCYVYVDTRDIYAIVTKGKDGYEPFEQAKYPDKERNREYVAKLNRELGVTDTQVGAMTMAAMFGWADKDADPRSFNGGKSHKEVTLAERLVAFAKNTDFYDYTDNLEIGETDEDAIRIMSEHLSDKTFCEGIISYLSDYAAERSIDAHEAQQTFDTPDYSRVEEIQSLIHDLTEHTATLEDKAEPDHSDMIGDEIVIDGSHFIIEEVKGDYVSMRDVTFAENAGFPIFRRERLEDIFPLLPEKEEPVVEILPAPPQQPKSKVRTFDLHPEIPLEARHNYNFAEKEIENVGKKERFRRNIEAINVLKECEFEGRFATPKEQEILSQYVGWGGIPEAFDPNNSAWADEYKELIVALSPEEYDAAMESTLTAFYTPQTVISAIYKALENLDFKQGNILEPSCGIGNFIGMLPDSMKDSKMYGIELDSISAQIAQQLYQKSSVLASPFEEAILPDSFFDAVVGNVPFGDFKVADKRYDKNNFLIHDYFFAKSLDKLRTGGVMLLVTSMGTMDKENSNVRRYIAQRADLLGAIRLPNDTFKGNAGTDVTSDILILQKRDRIVNEEPDWLMLDTTEDGIRMNKYFVDHPEMIMGNMVMKSGRFGPEPTCEPFEDRTLEEQLNVAIRNIKGEITEYEIDEEEIEDDRQYLPADPTVRNFSYTVVDGTIFYRENSMMKEVKVSATAENRIKGLINIRQSVRRLIELQTEDYSEEEIQSEQQNLNELYDGFTTKYGLINSRANKSAFADDGSYYLLTALEVLDDEGNLEKDIVTAKKNPKSIGDTFVGMVVNGVPYSEKADAGQAIIDVCKTLPDTQIYPLGEYRGFKLSVHYEPFSHQHRVTIKGAISHEGVLGTDAIGNITRIDNVIDGLEQMLTTTKALRDTTETQLANAKEQLEKPFAKDEELKQKEARLRELNALLNVDKRENEMVDEEPDMPSEDAPKRTEQELEER